jgi:hypothetical protein
LPHSFSGNQATAYEALRILEIMLGACIYQVDSTLEPSSLQFFVSGFLKRANAINRFLKPKLIGKPRQQCFAWSSKIACSKS